MESKQKLDFTDSVGNPLFIGSVIEQTNFNGEPYIARYEIVIDPEDNEIALNMIYGNEKAMQNKGFSALGYINNGKLRKGIVVETASLCYCNNCEKTLIDKNPSDQIELPIPLNTKELVLIKEDEDYFWVCPFCQSDENLIDLG